MRISLLSVPVEPNYLDLQPKAKAGVDVFVSIRSEGRSPILPKIAVVSLVKWMERHGYGPETYDFYDVDMQLPSDERLAEYFRTYKPDVVGLSAVVSTCYFQVRRISRILRAVCPDAWIVMGGNLAASANLVLRKTDVDLCVVGDGEIAWVKFLDYAAAHGRKRDYEALSKIRGLAYLNDHGDLQFTGYGETIPEDEMTFPDYDLLRSGLKDRPEDLQYYFRKGLRAFEFQTDPRSYEPGRRPNMATFLATKGCVAKCTFCQRSVKGYRVPRLDALEEHLIALKERFDVGFIVLNDENFASDIGYAYECARLMHKHGMLWWANGVRVSSLCRDDIKFFKEHGCASIKFGVETGSQKIMNVMEKKFTPERVYETLKHCADFGISSPLAVMVGMPGETDETAAATGRFLGRISHMQGIEPRQQDFSVFYALPLTGTPLYLYGQQIGALGRTPGDEESVLMAVSGTGPSKVNYINLNGGDIRDVIFWDWLVKLEATRTFLELDRASPIDRSNFIYRTALRDQSEKGTGMAVTRRLRLFEVFRRMRLGTPSGIKAKLFYAFDNFLENRVVYNPWAHKLPRWLLYGAVKRSLYAVYLLQGLVARLMGREFNIFRSWPAVPTLDLDSRPDGVRSSMSLRTVVRQRLAEKPPGSVTEKNRETLAFGV